MSDAQTTHLIRVEKGSPGEAELAALTAVLLAMAAGAGAEPDDVSRRQRAVARWRRPERSGAFAGPRTWRTAA